MDLSVDASPPSRARGRPKGSKNKLKDAKDTGVSIDSFDPDNPWNDYPPLSDPTGEKRGRGRPKGSKNKPGHKAGRPRGRKSNADFGTGDEDEDDGSQAPSPDGHKRARTGEPLEPHPLAGLHSPQLQHSLLHPSPSTSHHTPQGRNDLHAFAGDIPVDPSLVGGPRHDHHNGRHNSIISAGPSRQTIEVGRYSQSDYGLGIPVAVPSPPVSDTTSAAIAYFARETPQPVSQPAPHQGQIHHHSVPKAHPPLDEPSRPPYHHLHSSQQLSTHQTALNSLSGALSSKPDYKGKGVLHTAITPVAAEVGVSGVLRNLLPRDLLGSLPQVSGPFQLVETADRKRKLDGPLPVSTFDSEPGPVYVYIANYQPSQPTASHVPSQPPGGIPVGLASWKLTNPLTSEGKDRQRGPRKCGHCGKYECRGRGGRTWCPDFRAEQASGIPQSKGRSSSLRTNDSFKCAQDEDEGEEEEEGEGDAEGSLDDHENSSHMFDEAGGPYSALANFRSEEHHTSSASPGSNHHLSNSNGVTQASSSNQNQNDHSSGNYHRGVVAGGTDAEVHDSVLSLIQSILPQQAHNDSGRVYSAADFMAATTEYRDPGAPYGSSGMDIYNSKSGELDSSALGEGSSPGVGMKKRRAPRHCTTCKKLECPGKTQRKRCKEWIGDEGTGQA
ncbi:hypothetical protein P7C70_g1421, partial [Phenoliferia sp. Uapishka_3]